MSAILDIFQGTAPLSGALTTKIVPALEVPPASVVPYQAPSLPLSTPERGSLSLDGLQFRVRGKKRPIAQLE